MLSNIFFSFLPKSSLEKKQMASQNIYARANNFSCYSVQIG